MHRIITVTAAALSFALSGAATAGDGAARLSSIDGAVSISQGGKVATAKPGALLRGERRAALRPGDRIIAQDGEARLTYPDGCVVTLRPQSMITVADASPCASSMGLISTGGASAQATLGELTPGGWIMGILAVSGFIYGSIQVLDDEDPASP